MPSDAVSLGIVLMAEQKVDSVHLLVDKIAHRITQLDAPTIFFDFLLLLSKPAKRQTQAPQTPVRSVEFGPRTGDRHPQRWMRLLVRLRQDGARWHGPEFSLVTKRSEERRVGKECRSK